jgi:hypothetical protein
MPFDPAQDADIAGKRLIRARAAVELLTQNRTFVPSDVSTLFRSDSASNLTVTVPKDAREGANYAVAAWGTGSVTVAAEAGATNRSAITGTSGQYKLLSIIIVRNVGGNAAEFIVGEA